MGWPPDLEPLDRPLWAFARDRALPEGSVVSRDTKAAFWAPLERWHDQMLVLWESRDFDRLSQGIIDRRTERATTCREHVEGDPDRDYDTMLLSYMERTTPQFILRNVMRVTRDADPEFLEWGHSELPDRHGWNDDLDAVRAYRHEPPELQDEQFAGQELVRVREGNKEVFWENDWGEWYGEDKKRAMAGTLWKFVPEDGGKRTRPWKDIPLVPAIFWSGRLITEEY